jgi:hypothetical protein
MWKVTLQRMDQRSILIPYCWKMSRIFIKYIHSGNPKNHWKMSLLTKSTRSSKIGTNKRALSSTRPKSTTIESLIKSFSFQKRTTLAKLTNKDRLEIPIRSTTKLKKTTRKESSMSKNHSKKSVIAKKRTFNWSIARWKILCLTKYHGLKTIALLKLSICVEARGL